MTAPPRPREPVAPDPPLLSQPPPSEPPGAGVPRPGRPQSGRPRRWRWLRLVIPFAVVTVLWILTAVAHAYQEPDFGDAGTLAPDGTGRHGSSQLRATAARRRGQYRARHVERRRVDCGEVGRRHRLRASAGLSQSTLRPPADEDPGGLPPDRSPSGLATGPGAPQPCQRVGATADSRPRPSTRPATPTTPGRPDPPRSAATSTDGASPTTRCYGGSLIGFRTSGHEILLVGATDPFRNDRIGEAGNAALATGLLSEFGRVIWVDVHRLEATPTPTDALSRSGTAHAAAVRTRRPRPDQHRHHPVRRISGPAVGRVAGAPDRCLPARAGQGPPPRPAGRGTVASAGARVGGGQPAAAGSMSASMPARRACPPCAPRPWPGWPGSSDPIAIAPERELTSAGPAADRFVARIAARSGITEEVVEPSPLWTDTR